MPRGRALTENVRTTDVDVVVEQFICKDAALMKQVAVHRQSSSTWRLRGVARGEVPLSEEGSQEAQPRSRSETSAPSVEITATVHGGTLGTHVRVSADGNPIFPLKGTKDIIWDDIHHEWNFRGVLGDLGLIAPGERWIPGALPTEAACQPMEHAIQDAFLGSSALKSLYEIQIQGKRFPAVLTRQRPDGCFEVVAFKPDEYGVMRNVEYPCVSRSEIFKTGTSQTVELSESVVTLDIQKDNAHDMKFNIDGKSFQQCLGRASVQSRRIHMEVPRRQRQLSEQVGSVVGAVQESLHNDRNVSIVGAMKEGPITVDCGAAVLRHFLSGEVRGGDFAATRLSKSWKLQLGPFAEHVVELTKNRFSRILTLKVDGSILAECTGKELGCDQNEWRCQFRLLGERCIDFNVHPETKNGVQLESKMTVTKTFPFEHTVEVVYYHRSIDDLTTAELSIDNVDFSCLPIQVEVHNDPNLSVTREVMALSYGLDVPKKVLAQDTRGSARKVADRVWNEWKDPVNHVVAQKAADAGAFFSQLTSGAAQFIRLQHTAWSADLSQPAQDEGAAKNPPGTREIAGGMAGKGLMHI